MSAPFLSVLTALVSGLAAISLFDMEQRHERAEVIGLAVLAAGAMLVLLPGG